MQNVKPTDLPCVSNRLSQVSDVMDRVVAIAPAPLLPGENQADAKPRDAIEEFLVRDVIDLTWEVFRLRRARAGVLVASMSDGVRKVLDGLGHGRGEGPGYSKLARPRNGEPETRMRGKRSRLRSKGPD